MTITLPDEACSVTCTVHMENVYS